MLHSAPTPALAAGRGVYDTLLMHNGPGPGIFHGIGALSTTACRENSPIAVADGLPAQLSWVTRQHRQKDQP